MHPPTITRATTPLVSWLLFSILMWAFTFKFSLSLSLSLSSILVIFSLLRESAFEALYYRGIPCVKPWAALLFPLTNDRSRVRENNQFSVRGRSPSCVSHKHTYTYTISLSSSVEFVPAVDQAGYLYFSSAGITSRQRIQRDRIADVFQLAVFLSFSFSLIWS